MPEGGPLEAMSDANSVFLPEVTGHPSSPPPLPHSQNRSSTVALNVRFNMNILFYVAYKSEMASFKGYNRHITLLGHVSM